MANSYKTTKYVHKGEDLPEGDVLVALVDETYSSGDREDGYSSSPMVQIIVLGTREQALEWLREQEESILRYGGRKAYKIVSMKSLPIQRTVSLGFE